MLCILSVIKLKSLSLCFSEVQIVCLDQAVPNKPPPSLPDAPTVLSVWKSQYTALRSGSRTELPVPLLEENGVGLSAT